MNLISVSFIRIAFVQFCTFVCVYIQIHLHTCYANKYYIYKHLIDCVRAYVCECMRNPS